MPLQPINAGRIDHGGKPIRAIRNSASICSWGFGKRAYELVTFTAAAVLSLLLAHSGNAASSMGGDVLRSDLRGRSMALWRAFGLLMKRDLD